MPRQMTIYALLGGSDGIIRYIGQTIRSPHKRLLQHINTAKTKTTPPVNAWMRGQIAVGVLPSMVVIEECDSKEALNNAEVYWIEQFRAMGASLLNISPGGDTRIGYHHTDETRAKMSRDRHGVNGSMYGKHRSDAFRADLSEKVRLHWQTHRHPCIGRRRTTETIAKLKASKAGWRPSESHLAALREGSRRRWERYRDRRAAERALCEKPD